MFKHMVSFERKSGGQTNQQEQEVRTDSYLSVNYYIFHIVIEQLCTNCIVTTVYIS